MASNRQRHGVNRRLWAKLRDLSRGQAHLVDDPLGKRYDVNRFAIQVEHENIERATDLRQRLLADLALEGWEFEEQRDHFYGRREGYDGYIAIDYPHWMVRGGGARFNIGVH